MCIDPFLVWIFQQAVLNNPVTERTRAEGRWQEQREDSEKSFKVT